MKRFLSILSLFLFVSALYIFAPRTAHAEEIFIITGVWEQPEQYWKNVVVLEEGETLSSSKFPSRIIYQCLNDRYALEISWDVNDPSLNEPGLHYINGTPILPDDAVLAEGYDGMIQWPVFRKGENAVLPVFPVKPSIHYPLIPQDGDIDSALVFESASNKYCVGSDGCINISESISWQCDYAEIDVSVPGKYTMTRVPVLPEGYILDDSYDASYSVYVSPIDRIEIFAITELSGLGTRLHINWLYDTSNVTDPVLEKETEKGQWIPCDTAWYDYSDTGLIIYTLKVTADEPHTLRLRYQDIVNGESMERITESVILTIPSNILELWENTAPSDLINGDRDGSDNDSNELPDYEQPAPTPEATPTPMVTPTQEITPAPEISPIPEGTPVPEASPIPETTQEPVNEVVTDTYTAISGLRLQTLIDLGNTVLFEKQGLSLEIPSELLRNLNIKDYDLLEVTITHPQEDTVEIFVAVSGNPVESLTGTILYLPWGDSLEIDAPGIYQITIPEDTALNSTGADRVVSDTPEHIQEETTNTKVQNLPISLIAISIVTILLLMIYGLRKRWRHG